MSESLLGALIGGGITLVVSVATQVFLLLSLKKQIEKDIKIERIRIWDGKRFECYSELYLLVQSILDHEPDSEDDTILAYKDTGSYKSAIKNSLIFSPEIRSLLRKLRVMEKDIEGAHTKHKEFLEIIQNIDKALETDLKRHEISE